jgi:hypothetical protein
MKNMFEMDGMSGSRYGGREENDEVMECQRRISIQFISNIWVSSQHAVENKTMSALR